MLKKIPLYVFLLPVFVVLHVAAEFAGLINFRFVWLVILKIFFAQLCIFLFSRLFTGDLQKRSLITFAFSVIYFFFADAKDYLHNNYSHSLFASYTFLIPLIACLLTASVFAIKRSAMKPLLLFNKFLNLLLVLSIAADLPSFAGFASTPSRLEP